MCAFCVYVNFYVYVGLMMLTLPLINIIIMQHIIWPWRTLLVNNQSIAQNAFCNLDDCKGKKMQKLFVNMFNEENQECGLQDILVTTMQHKLQWLKTHFITN